MSLTTDQREAIDEWVSDHEDDLISFLQDIVAIHSATTIGED